MKTVLFTGATGGLGSCCIRRLAERGWTVFACGTRTDRLQDLAKEEAVIPIVMDVTDLQSVQQARATVMTHTLSLDAVVNFAGTAAFGSLVEGDPATQCERLLDLNVLGTVRVNRVFFDLVERGQGRIINCSSSAGWMKAQPFGGPYVLSKRALEAYNDSLRRELMYIDIPVIKIQPGTFRTNIGRGVQEDFDGTLAGTEHYDYVLRKMKPMMDFIFRHARDPEAVARVVVRALESRHPKSRYRVGSGLLLSLLELLPEPCVDGVYKMLFKEKGSTAGAAVRRDRHPDPGGRYGG